MTRRCLSKEEIVKLTKLLMKVFDYIKKLKESENLANRIQYPKIPSILSESIVIHLIKEKNLLGLSEISSIDFGGRASDIIVEINHDKKIKVEVKATGKSEFEYFGEKDISADYLVWVNFGDFFLDKNRKNILIFTIKNPSRYFKRPVKITLKQLRNKIGKDLKEILVNVNDFGGEQ